MRVQNKLDKLVSVAPDARHVRDAGILASMRVWGSC